MKFKAVLFDLDGTLLDTLEDLADSTNVVLAAFGYAVHDIEAYKYFVGDGIRNLMIRALPEDRRDDAEIGKSVEAFRMEYGRRWDKKTRPYKGVPQLLDVLAEKNIRMAVLSNKADEFTRRIVEKLLPDWRFEAVIGETAGMPRKPDPAGAIRISELLGIPPCEFLYLGDTGVDMITAARAGMYPVGALWGFRESGELSEAGALALISRPEALLDLL